MYFIDNMTDIYDDYPFIVKRLCREENQDNSMLFKMLDMLDDVNKGNKSLSNVETTLGNELAEKFLYPVLKKDNKN